MSRAARILPAALFSVAGAFSIGMQALLFREYLLVHHGSELAIGLFFGSWVLWVAAGAGSVRLLSRWSGRTREALPLLGFLWALSPLLQIALIRSLRDLAGVEPWEVMPLWDLARLTVSTLVPVSFLTGALFAIGCGLYGELRPGEGKAIVSTAWVAECGGAFAGGGLVTWATGAGVGSSVQLAAGMACVAAAALLLACVRRAKLQAAFIALALLFGCGWLLLGGAAHLRAWAEDARWRNTLPAAERLDSVETPYGHVAVGQVGEGARRQLVVAQGGELCAAYPDEIGPTFDAAVLMSQRPDAGRILVLAHRPESLLVALLAYPVREITWVDPDPAATAFVRAHLPAAEQDATTDPRVRTVHGEPRSLLRSGELQGGFDIVAVLTGDPETAYANRLFTADFVREAADRMAPGAVLVTRLQAEQSDLADPSRWYGASIYRAVSSVLPFVTVAPGAEQWLMACAQPGRVTLDGRVLRDRLAAIPGADARARHLHPDRFVDLWDEERAARLAASYEARAGEPAGSGTANTDERPAATLYSLLVSAHRSSPGLFRALQACREAGIWLFLVPLLMFGLGAILQGRSSGARSPAGVPPAGSQARFHAGVLVGVMGGVGFGAHLLLLHAFQSHLGALYGDVGFLNGLAMLGLFSGGLAARIGVNRRLPGLRAWLAALIGLQVVLLLALPLLLPAVRELDTGPSRRTFHALFFLAGTLTGAAFPAAERLLRGGDGEGRQKRLAPPFDRIGRAKDREPVAAAIGGGHGVDRDASLLEAADHIGAALGAGLTGTLMVPLLGLELSSYVLAGAAALLAPVLAGRLLGRWGVVRPSFPVPAASHLLFFCAVALVALAAIVRGGSYAQDRGRLEPQRLVDLGLARSVEERLEPFAHYVMDPDLTEPAPGGEPAGGVALSTLAVAPDVRGYAGPLNLLLAVDREGTIRAVRVLEHTETPAYVRGLDGWLRKLEGRPLADLRLSRLEDAGAGEPAEVDALSGATVTAQAVVRIVNESRRAVARDVLGRGVPEAEPGSALSGFLRPGPLYVLLSLLVAMVLVWRGTRRLRIGFLVVNLAAGGLWLGVQLSTVDLAALLELRAPSLATPQVWLLTAGVVLLSVLLGQVYCGYVCPFGALQELLSLLGLARPPGPRLDLWLRYVKYVLLFALVAAFSLGAGREVFGGFDPLQHVFGPEIPGPVLAITLVVLVLSVLSVRPWCRYLCPLGAALSLSNKMRLLSRVAPRKCYGRCDLGVTHAGHVDCLQCDRCIHGSGGAQPAVPERPAFWRRAALVAGIVALLGLLASTMTETAGLALREPGGASPAVSGPAAASGSAATTGVEPERSTGKARDADMVLLKARMERGQLSDEPARYFRVLREDERPR